MRATQDAADRVGAGGYAFLLCAAVLAAAGLVGLLVRQRFLFPSLGPVVILFFDSPRQAAATPRNTLIGHAVAIVAAGLCLAAFALALVTVLRVLLNRLFGVRRPLWARRG